MTPSERNSPQYCRTVRFLPVLASVLLSSFLCARTNTPPDNPDRAKMTTDGRAWVEQTVKSLSLEEKVGQMLQVRYCADYRDFDIRMSAAGTPVSGVRWTFCFPRIPGVFAGPPESTHRT